jgi:hypothetical protein
VSCIADYSDWRIILLFVLGAILIPVFFLWERYIDKKALIPLSILKNRTQLGASGFMFFLMCAMLGGKSSPAQRDLWRSNIRTDLF